MQVSERINPPGQKRRIFYGWWLVGLSGIVMTLASVSIFQGMPAWFVALESKFGWNRTQLILAFSFTRIEGSITGPVGGYFIDKLGPRRMILIGLLVMGGGLLLFSQIQNLWQFYLAFIVMSLGMGLGSWLPVMTVLNSWFIRRRATAMGSAMFLFSFGGILLVPALAWYIDPEKFGPDRWRSAAAALGVICILLAWPISRLIRNRPEDVGQHPDGRPPAPASSTSLRARPEGTDGTGTASTTATSYPDTEEPDYTWQEAVRTRAFWLMSIGHASSSMVIITLTGHMGLMLTLDRGISLPTVGLVIATQTGVAAVSTLVGGHIGDRMSMRHVIFGFCVIQSGAVVVLLLVHSVPMAFLFAVLLGIGFGGRVSLTTAMRGVYFGRKAFASITGISMLPMNAFALGMPLFAAIWFDIKGSYDLPFILLAITSFLGSCLFLLMGDPKPSPSSQSAPQASRG